MGSRTNLDELDVVLRRRNERYLATIPQAGLYAAGDSASAAMQALEAKKEALKKEFDGAGDLYDVVMPAAAPRPEPGIFRALALFTAKVVIVVILIGGGAVVTGNLIGRSIDRQVQFGGGQFWSQLERELARAGDPDKDIPAAKKEQLLAQIRVVVERWRPFVREVGKLFSDANPPPPAR